MKKTLAIVLSVMMVLSLCTGMFSFAAEKGYAETEADKFWGEAVKANAITLQIGAALVDVNKAVTDAKIADLVKDVEVLSEAEKTAGNVTFAYEGSISFDANGNLTIKGAKVTKTTKATEEGKEDTVNNYGLLIHANGGLKVVIEKGFTGSIRGLDHKNAAGEDVKVPAKSHLIVTAADHSTWNMPANGIGWDNGNVVVYGDVRLAGDAGTGYDCIIVRNNTKTDGSAPHKEKGWSLILAPEYATFKGDGANGLVENRSGAIVISDDAIIVGTCVKGKVFYQSGVGYGMTIRDNAMVHCTTTAAGSWAASVQARKFDMDGGTLVINMTADPAQAATTALNVQGAKDEGSALNFNGGKVFINAKAAEGSDKNNRVYAIFVKNVADDAVNFKGSEVYINITNSAIAADADGNNGVISNQAAGSNITMTAGKLTIDADANSQIFNPAVNPTTISIKGGDFVVNGGKSLLRPGAGNVTLAVDAAAKLKINTNLGIGRVVDTTVVTGIELAADKAAAITQGTATAITAKTPAAPEAPKIDVPETSDASVAAIVAVALISVAAAVVVLRKRVNG